MLWQIEKIIGDLYELKSPGNKMRFLKKLTRFFDNQCGLQHDD